MLRQDEAALLRAKSFSDRRDALTEFPYWRFQDHFFNLEPLPTAASQRNPGQLLNHL
jgi:hypothetical protein